MTAPTIWTRDIVHGVDRCPQCGVSSPLISTVSAPSFHFKDRFDNKYWHLTCMCSKCKRHILYYGHTNRSESPVDGKAPSAVRIDESFPANASAALELPEKAKRFLQQAIESVHAPDGALMLAASAIDAMMKDKGYKGGSLFERIEKASGDGLLTTEMRDWAHEIRLSANEPRHADDDYDGATAADANEVLAFAKALGEYLFVLPARVLKWKNLT